MKRFILFVLMVSCICVVSTVKAASPYVTTLVLPDNSAVSGATRSYASGSHILDMSIDGWYSTCSADPNKTQIRLWGDSAKLLSEVIVSTKPKTSIYKMLGTFPSGPKRYSFASKFELSKRSNYYCGIRSNYVAMYPKA